MHRQLPGGDTEPWYRQFWPWFLILLPASVVVAGLSTVYIANRGADDLVVDEYYKNGLAINRRLEKKQRALEQGISATLAFSEEQVVVDITGPVIAAHLQLLLSHPMESDRDFTVTLSRDPAGSYRAALPQPVAPRWHWTLEPPQPQGWRLDGSVQASDIGNASIE